MSSLVKLSSKHDYSLEIGHERHCNSPDLIIFCQGEEEVHCHQVIMAINCSLIKEVLKEVGTVKDNQVVLLPDFSRDEVSSLIDVMYGRKDNCVASSSLMSSLGMGSLTEELIDRIVVQCEIDKVSAKMSFECPECGHLSEDLEALYRHIEMCDKVDSRQDLKKTNIQGLFKCPHCFTLFFSSIDIDNHSEECQARSQEDEDVSLEIEETIVTLEDDNRIIVESVTGDCNLVEDQYDFSFICNECSQTFSSMTNLERHQQEQHTSDMFSCSKCDISFPQISPLNDHIVSYHSDPRKSSDLMSRCGLCTKVMIAKGEMDLHFREKHPSEDHLAECMTCDKVFKSVQHLVRHDRSAHVDIRLFQCGKCEDKFTLASSLHNHVKTCGLTSASPLIRSLSSSPDCEKGLILQLDSVCTSSEGNKKEAKISVDSCKMEERITMSVQDDLTVLEDDIPDSTAVFLLSHIDREENEQCVFIQTDPIDFKMETDETKCKAKDRKFVCNFCNNRYYAKDHLMSHIRTHTGEKPYNCEKCGEKFMYRSTWTNHRIRCIEGPNGMNKFRKFDCGFCSSSFMARDHLRQHERIHTGEKPWKCEQCGEQFQYRNRWKTHVRKCTGSEPVSSKLDLVKNMAHKKHGQFKCTECDQIFKKTNRLEKHGQTMHPGMQYLKCALCDDQFAYEISLRDHMENHKTACVVTDNEVISDPHGMLVVQSNETVIDIHQEQIIECETIFQGDLTILSQDHEEEILSSNSLTDSTNISKSPRKRLKKRHHDEIYEI